MLTLSSVLCPCCGAPVDIDGGSSNPRACDLCHNELLVSTVDPSRHCRSEIDSDFHEGSFGAIGFVIHPRGTNVCAQCALIYPSAVECCPGLIKFAINWYCESDVLHSQVSRSKILDFIRRHPNSARLFISVQVLESEINGESDIPVDTLLDIAKMVDDSLLESLKKYRR